MKKKGKLCYISFYYNTLERTLESHLYPTQAVFSYLNLLLTTIILIYREKEVDI